MGITQGQVKGNYPQNNAHELRRADTKTQGGTTGMDKQFPFGKHAGKAKRDRWLASQPTAVLYLASLEKT